MKVSKSVREALDEYLQIRQSLIDIYGDSSEGRVLIRTNIHVGEPLFLTNVGVVVERLAIGSVSTPPPTRSEGSSRSVSTTRRCNLQADSLRVSDDVARMVAAFF